MDGDCRSQFEGSLTELSRNVKEWTVLFQCSDCGQLWDLKLPESELQGGGPQILSRITKDEAKRRYSWS